MHIWRRGRAGRPPPVNASPRRGLPKTGGWANLRIGGRRRRAHETPDTSGVPPDLTIADACRPRSPRPAPSRSAPSAAEPVSRCPVHADPASAHKGTGRRAGGTRSGRRAFRQAAEIRTGGRPVANGQVADMQAGERTSGMDLSDSAFALSRGLWKEHLDDRVQTCGHGFCAGPTG